MTFPVHYQPAARATSGPTPGAKALMAWCLANYPPGTNLGIYNPRSVRGGQALSLHAEGRAIDVGYPPVRPDGHQVGQVLAADMVRHHAELGVQCVIFARRIWSNTRPTWRPYTGTADHFDHVHIELTRAAGAGLTTDIIRQTMEAPMPAENPYPAETAEALQLLAEHAGYQGDRKWFGPDALAALHRLKNRAEDLATKNVDLAGHNVTLASERDTALANREAAEAEAAQLRRQIQEGSGRAAVQAIAADLRAKLGEVVIQLQELP